MQLSPLGNRERCVAIASAGPNIAPPGGNDVTLAAISQNGIAVLLGTLGTAGRSTGSSRIQLLPFSLLVGNEVRWLANEGQEVRNGPRLKARVAGMASIVRKAALDAAWELLWGAEVRRPGNCAVSSGVGWISGWSEGPRLSPAFRTGATSNYSSEGSDQSADPLFGSTVAPW